MKRKIVVPIVLLAALAVAAGLLWSGWLHRDHPNRLVVSGNLELTQVDISFKIAGRMTERKVDEGQWIKKGSTPTGQPDEGRAHFLRAAVKKRWKREQEVHCPGS